MSLSKHTPLLQPQYTQEQIEAMNKTYRHKGAVGKNAIVPKFVAHSYGKKTKILDYGSGTHCPHAKWLRDRGFAFVDSYDIGGNATKASSMRPFRACYDVVMLSNVLNVQPSLEHVKQVLEHALSCCKCTGKVICNYPSSPRKVPELGKRDLKDLIYGPWYNDGGILLL